jgi:SpoVK/Ycf46/Vps4 family AAA+-type ATPase
LFNRIGSFIDIAHNQVKLSKKEALTYQPKFTFVDLEDSKEEQKKESFTNEVEANAVADLLAAFEIDLATCAVMTPYRT